MTLTAKQEAFAVMVFEGSSAAEAYRTVYDVGENTKPNTIWRKASELLSQGKVAARVAELRVPAAEAASVTVESITKELNEGRALAVDQEDAAEMRQASMAKAKLHGLLVDKTDLTANFSVTIEGDDAKL